MLWNDNSLGCYDVNVSELDRFLMSKLISVVIPTYERYETTIKAIESVDCAEPELVEIIVVDDCSKVPFSYLKQKNINQSDVRVFSLKRNSGPGLARKLGVEKAAAQHIAFLDSDDLFNPNWIDFLLNTLRRFPSSKLYVAGFAVGGKGLGNAVTRLLAKLPIFIQTPVVRYVFILFNPFYTPTLFMHRDCCYFSRELRYCEDYYTNALGAFSASKILVVSQASCELGREPNSLGGESGNQKKMQEGEKIVRNVMLKSTLLPTHYRVLVPLGMVYQQCRTWLKVIKFKFFDNRSFS
jgi:hypothetical protein